MRSEKKAEVCAITSNEDKKNRKKHQQNMS